jgi:2-polyprenyl-6-methoxyphenol hydroxylase-like FAD-dependent oxidoreductase
MNHPDVVISGGGIGGAVLAALLVQGGKRVTIVERATGPPPFLRPELLWPPALRTLERIRPLAFWEQDCLRRAGGLFFQQGGKLRPFATGELFDRAGVRPYFEHPNNLRETMLAVCGAEVRRGVEVTGLLRDGSRVTGVATREIATGETGEIAAVLTVGDDGGHSAVRTACGITCELRTFPLDFFAAGQPWPGEWKDDEIRVFVPVKARPGGLTAFGLMPLPGGHAATLGIAPVDADEARLAVDFAALMAENPDIPATLAACRFPAGYKRIGRQWGSADSYGVPGCVLIGDAIHPVSPAGGQGANMAIGDAAALARFILENNPDPAGALWEERRAMHERGIRPTRLAATGFKLGSVPGARWLVGALISLVFHSEGLRLRAFRSLGSQSPGQD